MNRKIIKSILQSKIKSWIDSIEDANLRDLCRKNVIVTGGSIVSMLLKEKVKDYDVYFRNKETALKIAKYYVAKFKENIPASFSKRNVEDVYVTDENDRIKIVVKSSGVAEEKEEVKETVSETKEKPKFRPVFLSGNAITLSDKIQLIVRFYGEPAEIHLNYDFIHCTCYWDIKTGELVLPEKALESMITKQLYYSGSRYPVCSMFRIRKFMQRGWFINAGQILKIAWQISELDLKNIDTFEDQLIGVDTTYFQQIIDILQERREKNPEFVIDGAYVAVLVDKIF